MSNWKKVIYEGANATVGKLTVDELNITSLETGNTESRVAVVAGPSFGAVEGFALAITQSLLVSQDTTYAADGNGITLNGTTFNIVQPEGLVHDDTFHTSSTEMAHAHVNWEDAQAALTIHSTNLVDTTYTEGTGVDLSQQTPTVGLFSTDQSQAWTELGTAATPLDIGSITSGFGTISTTGSIETTANLSAPSITASTTTTSNWLNNSQVSASSIQISDTLSVGNFNSAGEYLSGGQLEIEGTFFFNTLEFKESVISHHTASQIFGYHTTHSHQLTGSMFAGYGIEAQSFTGSGELLTNIPNNAFSNNPIIIGDGLAGEVTQDYNYSAANSVRVNLNNTPGANLDIISNYESGGEQAYRLQSNNHPDGSGPVATIAYPGAGVSTLTMQANFAGASLGNRGGWHRFQTAGNMASAPEAGKAYRVSVAAKTSTSRYRLRVYDGQNNYYYLNSGPYLTNTAFKTFEWDIKVMDSTNLPYIRVDYMNAVGQTVSLKDFSIKEIVGISMRGATGFPTYTGGNNGIYISGKSITESMLNTGIIDPARIADSTIQAPKLNSRIIYVAPATTSMVAADQILVTSPVPEIKKTTNADLRTEIVDIIPTLPGFDWNNNAGGVTQVTSSTAHLTHISGLQLQQAGLTGNVILALTEELGDGVSGLAIDNTNFTGSRLEIGNGGVLGATAAASALNVFSQDMGGALTIGDGQDEIYISGSLYVTGTNSTVNTFEYKVSDKIIGLGQGATDVVADFGIKFGHYSNNTNTLIYSNHTGNHGQKGRLGFGQKNFDPDTIGSALTDGALTHFNAIGVFSGSSGSAGAVEANQDGNMRIDNSEIYFHV